ncbi:coiled-coil domain-containing protein 97 [Quillaja saponaria]|uniref:Coiled-coil domain-containing protein 97 n=1 Tax=Quillaja saponaria TaxID=32244 RepID=A0AAD7KTG3_QUISA|nr:coiled-coil domain-containing protein 97 [Quillaja saponaria]
MEKISERLSSLENLYFPRALQSNATDPSQRKSIFLDLLSRDTALFLVVLVANGQKFLIYSIQAILGYHQSSSVWVFLGEIYRWKEKFKWSVFTRRKEGSTLGYEDPVTLASQTTYFHGC